MTKIETLESQLGRARQNLQMMIENGMTLEIRERQERLINNLKRRIMEQGR